MNFAEVAAPKAEILGRFRALYDELQPARRSFPRLFACVDSHVHGADHWARVALFGRVIARSLRARDCPGPSPGGPEAIEEAVTLSAFFHDCARWSDGLELDHGRAGEEVWRWYVRERKLPEEMAAAVSQALLFHVDHPAVDPAAGPVAVCLCNADRLDRVRLGQSPAPLLMYDDGAWRELEPLAETLLDEVSRVEALRALGVLKPQGATRG